MDIKIKEVGVFCESRMREITTNGQLQDAVTTAHETSTAFSDEVIKEHDVFELSKQQEMKEMMETYADGQVEMFQRVSDLLIIGGEEGLLMK